MTLHLAASFSYDVMIIALSGYFSAVCLDLAYKAERVEVRDVAVLALVMAVMGPCKMVYGVIAGFCLLIPVRKFGAGEMEPVGCIRTGSICRGHGSGKPQDGVAVHPG